MTCSPCSTEKLPDIGSHMVSSIFFWLFWFFFFFFIKSAHLTDQKELFKYIKCSISPVLKKRKNQNTFLNLRANLKAKRQVNETHICPSSKIYPHMQRFQLNRLHASAGCSLATAESSSPRLMNAHHASFSSGHELWQKKQRQQFSRVSTFTLLLFHCVRAPRDCQHGDTWVCEWQLK